MKKVRNKALFAIYEPLPLGILVLGAKWQLEYYNPAYKEILAQGAAEFGGWQNIHDEFVKSSKAHRNVKAAVARLMLPSGRPLPIQVVTATTKFADGVFHIFCLVPRPEIVSGFVDEERSTYMNHGLRVNALSQTVYYLRKFIALSDLEFRVLLHFCTHEEVLLTKATLLQKVWGRRVIESRVVDITVSRLRRKLHGVGCKKPAIRTVHGRGYVLTSD